PARKHEAGGEDALVGNVNKLMVSPPGYTGVPRKGHLVFDACFESGNLGRVDYISEFEFDLFIRPDTCNPRFRVWFNFTVENVRETQRVIFNIVNFSKTKSLYRDGMSPVVKSTSRPKWQRLPAKNVYYYRCPDHRRNYVMSFAFCFDREDDVYQFAYCYPYTYSRLQHYLASLERRNLPYLQREQLGLSVQQRRLDLLTITNSEREKKLVFLTARVHPGESPASFVCQGVIDFLVSQHPVAQILRDHVIFKIVPMLNPDGVYLGNYRCSLMGFDLNRHWQDPSPWAHPTLHAVKQLIVQMNQDPHLSCCSPPLLPHDCLQSCRVNLEDWATSPFLSRSRHSQLIPSDTLLMSGAPRCQFQCQLWSQKALCCCPPFMLISHSGRRV
uniref:AGBL carboxypeptidase 4 n=1 Tax=Amphiprion percula TaxID=161767 RepID=A0A3P8U694_AMPPE